MAKIHTILKAFLLLRSVKGNCTARVLIRSITPRGAKSVAVLDGTTYAGDTVGNAISTGNTGAITVTSEIDDINGDFISNAYSGSYNGSALRINEVGTVKEINSNFIGNSSAVTYQYAHAASAIDNLGTITTLNGDFIGNTTAKQGVIYNGGTITNINGDFVGNNDVNGAIYNASTIVDINSNFIANNSSSGGGGIYNAGSITGKIKGIFHNNNATQGAAILNYNGNTINEIDGTFTNNTANSSGGALFINGNVNSINGTFENNTATTGEGGAIYVSDYTPGATGSALVNVGSISGTFKNNTAATNGGAIYSRNKLDSLSGVFENNTAGASGGAIYSGKHNASDILNISNSTFENNTASGTDDNVGGGAIWNTYKLSIDNSIFENNTANKGGAIYNVGNGQSKGDVTVTDSSFIGNKAISGEGGAIYQKFISSMQPSMTIYAKTKDIEFTNNNTTGTSEGTGTGIHIANGTLNLNADEARKIVINDNIYSAGTNTINANEGNTGTVEINGGITNAMSMTVNNGTLKLGQKAVNDTSTTTLGTMTFTTANTPTLDLQNESYGTLKVNKITGDANLKIDLDLANTDNVDVIKTSTASTGTNTLTVSDLNLSNIDADLTNGKTFKVLDTQSNTLRLAIDEAVAQKDLGITEDYSYIEALTSGDAKWSDSIGTHYFKNGKKIISFTTAKTATDDDSILAQVSHTGGVEDPSQSTSADTLSTLVQSDDFATKTFTADTDADYTVTADLGTLKGTSLTIDGSNHSGKILGNNKAGITIADGQTLTVKNVNEIGGFDGDVITNGGTLNLVADANNSLVINNGINSANGILHINRNGNTGTNGTTGTVELNGASQFNSADTSYVYGGTLKLGADMVAATNKNPMNYTYFYNGTTLDLQNDTAQTLYADRFYTPGSTANRLYLNIDVDLTGETPVSDAINFAGDDVISFAVCGSVTGSLNRNKIGKLLLTPGKHRKTIVRSFIVHQIDPHGFIRIITVIDGTQTCFQSLRGIVHGNDDGNLRCKFRHLV